jgi:hypothetical protein
MAKCCLNKTLTRWRTVSTPYSRFYRRLELIQEQHLTIVVGEGVATTSGIKSEDRRREKLSGRGAISTSQFFN